MVAAADPAGRAAAGSGPGAPDVRPHADREEAEASIAALGPGPGPRAGTPGGGIPPEYEPYVRALRQRVQERLVYPWMAVRRGQQGVVELELRLGPEGRLIGVEVVAGAGGDALRAAAVAAVRRSAPFPFPAGVEARPLVIRLPVEFRLR
jgi:protein TonB